MNSWKADYTREIEHAVAARGAGNEGMARVCARRAAGIIIGEYLHRHGDARPKDNAYDRLARFMALPEIDDQVKEVCSHFLMKVDLQHKLPGDPDLVAEVNWLERALLGQAHR